MKLYGEVKSLKVLNSKIYWDSANLFQFFTEDPVEVGIYIGELCQPLIDFLTNRSTLINEPYSEERKDKARVISVPELKLKYCLENKSLFDREKVNNPSLINYKYCDQLKSLISRIEMIAELGEVSREEIFLRFCLV